MKLAIMQPYFMPYIGYFQCIAAVDKYMLYSNLTFIKEAWMNRNRVLMNDGKIQTITVPLNAQSSNKMIYDINIDNSQPWLARMLKTIYYNYKKAKYFDENYPFIENLLSVKYEKLMDMNCQTIKAIANYLDLDTEIVADNSSYLDLESDLNDLIEKDYVGYEYLRATRPIKKVARVIMACKREKSCNFINAIGGQNLYSKEEFKQYGIDIRFVKTDENLIYNQGRGDFVPNLSIIDVLMHNGKEGTKDLLNKYTLV